MNDSDLKYIQRVLESNAPDEDRERAAQMVRDIRRSYGQAPAASPDFPHYEMAFICRVLEGDHPEKADLDTALGMARSVRVALLKERAAQAPAASAEPPQVTDAEIEEIVRRLGASWTGDAWKIEDADLHPAVRALLYRYTAAPVAASAEPVGYLYQIAGALLQEGWKDWREEFSREAPPQWMIDEGKVKDVTPVGKFHSVTPRRWKCAGCGDGSGWYTSYTTGYPHAVPCRRCNPDGSPKHTISQLESDPFLAASVMRSNAAPVAAQAPQHVPMAAAGPEDDLYKFYGVETDAALIAAQQRHIEKLQARIGAAPSLAPQRPREG